MFLNALISIRGQSVTVILSCYYLTGLCVDCLPSVRIDCLFCNVLTYYVLPEIIQSLAKGPVSFSTMLVIAPVLFYGFIANLYNGDAFFYFLHT